MILDSKKQKDLLLQIFNAVNVPVSVIEQVLELKKALESAGVKEDVVK